MYMMSNDTIRMKNLCFNLLMQADVHLQVHIYICIKCLHAIIIQLHIIKQLSHIGYKKKTQGRKAERRSGRGG